MGWGKRLIDHIDTEKATKQHSLHIARPQLVRLGYKMRTFTPRRSVHPTDSDDHFVPGMHAKLVNAH